MKRVLRNGLFEFLREPLRKRWAMTETGEAKPAKSRAESGRTFSSGRCTWDFLWPRASYILFPSRSTVHTCADPHFRYQWKWCVVSIHLDRSTHSNLSQIKWLWRRRSVKLPGLFRISALKSTLLFRINGLICFLYKLLMQPWKMSRQACRINSLFIYIVHPTLSLIDGIEFFFMRSHAT